MADCVRDCLHGELVWRPVATGSWQPLLRASIKNDCHVDDSQGVGDVARALVGTVAPVAAELSFPHRIASWRTDRDDAVAVHLVFATNESSTVRFELAQNGRRKEHAQDTWQRVDATACPYAGCECGRKEPAMHVRSDDVSLSEDGCHLHVGLQFNEVSSHRAANPDSTRAAGGDQKDGDDGGNGGGSGAFQGFFWLRAHIDDTMTIDWGPLITLEKFGNKYRDDLDALGAAHLVGRRSRPRPLVDLTQKPRRKRARQEDAAETTSDHIATTTTTTRGAGEWASAAEEPVSLPRSSDSLPFGLSVTLMRRVVSQQAQRAEDWHMVSERTAAQLRFGTLHAPTDTHALCALDLEFSRRVRNTSRSRRFQCMSIDTLVPVCIARWWDGAKVGDGNGDPVLMVEMCWPTVGSFDDPNYHAATTPLQYSEPYRVLVEWSPTADGPWSVLPVQIGDCVYSDRDTLRLPIDLRAFRYTPIHFRLHVSNGDAEQHVRVAPSLHGDDLATSPTPQSRWLAANSTAALPCCEGYEEIVDEQAPTRTDRPVADKPVPPVQPPSTLRKASKRPRTRPPIATAPSPTRPTDDLAASLFEMDELLQVPPVLSDEADIATAEREALRALARFYRAKYLQAICPNAAKCT